METVAEVVTEVAEKEPTRAEIGMMPKIKLQEFFNKLSGKGTKETPATSQETPKPKEDASDGEKGDKGGKGEKKADVEDLDKLTPEQLKEALKSEREANKKAKVIIGKQGNEIGDIRKQITEKEAVLTQLKAQVEKTPEELRDLFDENPKEAMKVLHGDETRTNRIKLEEMNKKALETELVINERIPKFDEFRDDMVNLLKEDGVEAELITAFKQNPYYAEPSTLFYLAKRVEALHEVAALKLENEKLKKATTNVSQRIVAAAGKPNGVLGKAGSSYSNEDGTNPFANMDRQSIALMPLKELRVLRKSAKT